MKLEYAEWPMGKEKPGKIMENKESRMTKLPSGLRMCAVVCISMHISTYIQ